ncbi:sugar phosphate isomerase/epimerase [Bacillaceae bacterium SIJ1]|uniref:sugar phosphate isomerase/epimerase family protein n=1 Tax=Litoribacterium kuwaitense TaxID=1398745 RepID=UPI0013EAA583|nr:sugar phosphate isomerase/epimerase family protein [Litoribacterium kuwaitense]NGP44628.1 sugar phosphate isomerase/epimerase [Litoribacterium kuwaitense]
MKVGLSSYSLVRLIRDEEMTILDAVDWVAENGGEHMEIVPFGFTLVDHFALADQVKERAAEKGIELSCYSILANLLHEDDAAYEEEVARIKEHVDVANRLGVKLMRHDVTAFRMTPDEMTIHHFNDFLPRIVEGSQRIADYAAQYGITTTIENHGFSVQQSDRVQTVIRAVDRENFRSTLDVGNFLCADEDPLVGVRKNLPLTVNVHFKDFYIRPFYENPGGGAWIRTVNENYLRGAIVGHGDIPIRQVIRLIKDSGYDGYLTIEFEGMEHPFEGSKIGMDNVRRFWNEAPEKESSTQSV